MFRDFDVFGIAVPPYEADAVLMVDADAVLSFSAAAQRFKPVARWHQEIGRSLGAIESNEAPERHRSDSGKFLDPLAFEQPFRLLRPEAPDHQSIVLCAIRRDAASWRVVGPGGRRGYPR